MSKRNKWWNPEQLQPGDPSAPQIPPSGERPESVEEGMSAKGRPVPAGDLGPSSASSAAPPSGEARDAPVVPVNIPTTLEGWRSHAARQSIELGALRGRIASLEADRDAAYEQRDENWRRLCAANDDVRRMEGIVDSYVAGGPSNPEMQAMWTEAERRATEAEAARDRRNERLREVEHATTMAEVQHALARWRMDDIKEREATPTPEVPATKDTNNRKGRV